MHRGIDSALPAESLRGIAVLDNSGASTTISEFLAIRWGGIEGPLIEPPRFSPIIADPTFLFPEETPEETWELFAHSAWGIHLYSSADGIKWLDRGLTVRNAMRPFVRKITGFGADGENSQGGKFANSPYFLLYEAYPPLALAFTALPGRRKWRSRIALSRSADLGSWSRPAIVARAGLPWMRDPNLGESVSNPCLVSAAEAAAGAGGQWRLYHSASLSWIEDCGFCEPRYIACATGPSPDGPFSSLPQPLIDPAQDRMPGVLGSGSLKAVRLADGWIGLQNKIYRDREGRSRSAIFLLSSPDGFAWDLARAEPLLAPAPGWTSSHIYACDCRFRAEDGLW
ncbi:MAG TPA: hypothetical protein VN437_07355, partial [Rectinemataceae bacterium]|nr:hypothetical protein [Rectinemataceae bacterium]